MSEIGRRSGIQIVSDSGYYLPNIFCAGCHKPITNAQSHVTYEPDGSNIRFWHGECDNAHIYPFTGGMLS